jgi:heparan-alpha-glucosaminide N-acetyltransferase
VTPTTPATHSERVVAVDVLRGLVILLLVPDVTGGFSFYRMAELEPDSAVWTRLAALFSHVEWSGLALWDMVMPAFVFLIGVSMALSDEKRAAYGETKLERLAHSALRSLALVAIGMLVSFPIKTLFDDSLPYLVLAIGLPWITWWSRLGRPPSTYSKTVFELLLPLVVLGFAFVWIVVHLKSNGANDLNQILVKLGLAYFPAYLLLGNNLRRPATVALVILVGWGLAFVAYSPPPSIEPIGEVFTGIFAHWNNGTNLAAGVDRWLLNLLPRGEPYIGNSHGYHTLEFVPLIAIMLAGAVVGRMLARGDTPAAVSRRVALTSVAGLLISGVVAETLSPVVKSLWTPSWTLLSTSLTGLSLAALLWFFDHRGRTRIGFPLAVLGTNAILLYVVALHDRWRILGPWRRLLGDPVLAVSWHPVLESLLVLATLWFVAFVLYRMKIFIRV